MARKPQKPKFLRESLANVTREICEKLYTATGATAVYDYANKVKLAYHKCILCDAETPTISDPKRSTCAICGTEKEIKL